MIISIYYINYTYMIICMYHIVYLYINRFIYSLYVLYTYKHIYVYINILIYYHVYLYYGLYSYYDCIIFYIHIIILNHINHTYLYYECRTVSVFFTDAIVAASVTETMCSWPSVHRIGHSLSFLLQHNLFQSWGTTAISAPPTS